MAKGEWDHTTLFVEPLDRQFQLTGCIDHVNKNIEAEELQAIRENEENRDAIGPMCNVPKEDQQRLLGEGVDFKYPWQSCSVKEAKEKNRKPSRNDLVLHYYPEQWMENLIFKDSRGE